MDIEHAFNFNDPIEVTEIFRFREKERHGEVESETMKEFGSKAAFCWEDVMFIKDYPYTDDWKTYIGPKYWVKLRNYPENILILGDYESMYSYWMQFRNTYPLFTIQTNGDNNGID